MGLFKEFANLSYDDWINQINKDLRTENGWKELVWESSEGIEVAPVYDTAWLADNLKSLPQISKQNLGWRLNENIKISSVQEANIKARSLIEQDVSSISFFGDISDQEEMNALLKEIDTSIVDLHIYTNDLKKTLSLLPCAIGSVSWNISKGEKFKNINDVRDLVEVTAENNITKTITINGAEYGNNGASIIQELAITLSQGVEYMDTLTNEGINAETVASKIQFKLSVGTNYFFEIAKIRAFRVLWSLVLQSFDNVKTRNATIHIATSRLMMTTEDVHFNILRTTTAAMSAIIGGCDTLSISGYDDTAPSADRIARNIHHILREESYLDKVSNPADGSYYIEYLTEEITKNTWQLFKDIEQKGGYLSELDAGRIGSEMKLDKN